MTKTPSFSSVLQSLLKAEYDEISIRSEEYARQLIATQEQFLKRNKELTKLLAAYIDQRDKRVATNAFFKKFLFWTLVGLLVLLTITVVIIVIRTDFNIVNAPSVVSLVSVFVTYLTSILSIFNIMAKYLFPSDEEKDAIGMISTVINNDLKVEKLMIKAIDNIQNANVSTLEKYKGLLDNNTLTDDEYQKLKSSILDKM